ncbi:phosphopantetheine-binding protein [Aedoeadaptatus acetigenes]|uniref:Phosphopantetheine-binding protein n=1 Tax=Aedoeadaptatus acetigenes TaxID=2981723 RepID=A0ABV1J4E6_9FIRM|nr:phosphopantetheine-binding protein [Aedoeadaptatus acetigenes]MBS6525354.1 acyl carrier protein [Peptoniphilaceae bacterium]MCU6785918.1 phosphopantetheine-binding protein [Aedoeadaptatus acetigenes]
MKESIIEIIESITGEVVKEDTDLIEEGILDSFDMVSLVLELQDAFDITIDVSELLPENFESVNTIAEFIDKL